MKKLTVLISTIILSFLGFTACNTGSSGGTGTMNVTMTDAPANYDSVNISINSVRIRGEEDDNDSDSEAENGDDEEDSDEWITISDQQIEVNLLELTNGSQISLGSKELESGEYSQIRLILGDDNTVTVDGETYNLQTPSAQQSGLKLNIDAEIEDDETYSLLIDFDAARSIVQQGNGNYLLKPVLRAVNLEETGSIVGNVQPADFNTNVLAVMDGDTVTSTITNDNGDFEIIGLIEGTYNVVFDPSSDQYSDSTKTGIEVDDDEETDLGTIELESNSTL